MSIFFMLNNNLKRNGTDETFADGSFAEIWSIFGGPIVRCVFSTRQMYRRLMRGRGIRGNETEVNGFGPR